jgi:3-oxoacyl-[acyl-carrier protein] reductase
MADLSGALAERVAIVTGGGSGLGRATCQVLAAAGATVLVADINGPAAEDTAADIQSGGGRAVAAHLDITDAGAVDLFMNEVSRRYGDRLDCLINNAGTDRGSDILHASEEQWRQVFAVNTDGPMHMTRAFLGHICQQPPRSRPADIVCVVSISALTVGAGASAYNASKAALLKFSEILQTELREYAIPARACILNPSAMNTPMMDQWQLPQEKMMDPTEVAKLILTALTLPPDMVLQSMVVTGRNEYYPR